MSKREAIILTIIAALAVIISVDYFPPFGYDRKEFDYATGKVRILHRTWGFSFSTTYEDFWIEPYAPIAQSPDWRLMRYVNSPDAPSINTKSGQLYSLIQTMGTMLENYSADEPTHKLVADYIFDRLNQTQTDPSAHFNVVDNFLYFTDIFPYPDDLYGTVTYDQILQTISQCTTPTEPSTIPP
ncbi:MAG: hypothetical protein JKX70_00570 [Phycisphaerales bacterium]|nr:hypothetical protein [Phycisphaerales bacterium]